MSHRPKPKLQLNFAWFWNHCPPKPQEQCFSWSGLVLFQGSLDSIPSVWWGALGCHYRSSSCCLYLHAPGWGGGIYTIRSHFPRRLGLGGLAQCGCKGFAWGGRLSRYLPQGTGSRAKTSYWCEWSWSCWVGRCPLFLGHVMECLGYWSKCGQCSLPLWIVLGAGVESVIGCCVVLLVLVGLHCPPPRPSWWCGE